MTNLNLGHPPFGSEDPGRAESHAWAGTGPMPKAALWFWNLVGLALLINIVTIAVLSAPLPIRMFHNEPANTLVAFFPYIWLPTFLVQAALGGHLLVFRYLSGHHQS